MGGFFGPGPDRSRRLAWLWFLVLMNVGLAGSFFLGQKALSSQQTTAISGASATSAVMAKEVTKATLDSPPPASSSEYKKLAAQVKADVLQPPKGPLGITIWTPDGTVVFSTNPN